MEARKKTANSFGVFLDSVNRQDNLTAQDVVRQSVAGTQLSSMNSAKSDGKIEAEILGLVAQSAVPLSVKIIIGQLDMAPSMVMTSLAQLANAKLVKMASSQKDEMVAITDLGKKLAY